MAAVAKKSLGRFPITNPNFEREVHKIVRMSMGKIKRDILFQLKVFIFAEKFASELGNDIKTQVVQSILEKYSSEYSEEGWTFEEKPLWHAITHLVLDDTEKNRIKDVIDKLTLDSVHIYLNFLTRTMKCDIKVNYCGLLNGTFRTIKSRQHYLMKRIEKDDNKSQTFKDHMISMISESFLLGIFSNYDMEISKDRFNFEIIF